MQSPRSSVTIMAALGAFLAHGQFSTMQDILFEGPRSVEVVDLDGDGDRDLLLGSRNGVMVLRNSDGLGTWAQPQVVAANEVVAHAVDVDGDGYLDIVASRDQGGGTSWFRNLGTFGFGPAQPVSTWGAARTITSGDLDADGDRDLVLLLQNNTVHISINTDGSGQFGPLQYVGALAGAEHVAVADTDGDDAPDLVLSSPILGETHVIANLGTGLFGPSALLSGDGHGMPADVDVDGYPDLVLADATAGQVTWKRQVNSTFTGSQTIGPGVQCQQLGGFDLDGDGDGDLVVALTANDEVAWYENIDGQGTFGPRQTIAYGVGDVQALAAGDTDGDGDAELFIASGDLDRFVWLENLAVAMDRIVGRVFNDRNGDGLFNGTDHGLYHVAVTVPGLGTTFTNHAGVYSLDATAGTHDVELDLPAGWVATGPVLRTVQVSAPQYSALGVDFPLEADGPVHAVEPVLVSSPLRCDWQVPYWLTVTNTGNQVGGAHVTLDLDDLSQFVSAEPAPDAVVNGVAEWHFEGLQPTHHRAIELRVLLPDWQYMGTTLHDAATAEALQNGQVMSSTSHDLVQVMDCAYDPNDKHAEPVGQGAQHLTPVGTSITYTIRFQNTGSAPATNVVLVDQLDEDLDRTTLRVLATSHTMSSIVDPSGELEFRFDRIHLPDSASDPMGSQGFVRFAIDHLPGVAEGTEITNTAAILFDANPAIVTNTVLNTLTYGLVGIAEDVAFDDLSVHPNPMRDNAVVWLGQEFQGRTDLVLSDALGRTVRAWSISGDRAELRREDLPRGLYLLRAVGRDGTERVVRVLMD